jgi:HNH endonuclease
MKTLRERFDAKHKVDASTGCWLWTAWRDRDGYGHIARGKAGEGMIKAHRASWILNVAEIPAGLQVLHRCDTPSCVNPDHLFLGTNADNRKDSVSKGRHQHGSRRRDSKLDQTTVLEIRKSTDPLRVAAARFGVSESYVSLLRRNLRWSHVE